MTTLRTTQGVFFTALKRILPFVLCLIPVSLFAAGVGPEPHQVFLFGNPNAIFVGF
jgi:hypothetical protein